jgi:hypothetical protein
MQTPLVMVERFAMVTKQNLSSSFQITNLECGIKYDPPNARIIGGADVVAHSWPFAVLIRQRYKNLITLDGKSYIVKYSYCF